MIEHGFSVERKGQNPSFMTQVHGRRVLEVRNAAGLESLRQTPPEADGAFTRASNLELSVVTADCIPVLAFSTEDRGPVAALHCGWRGAKNGILTAFREILRDEFDSLRFILGPSIGRCCFEIKEDFLAAFEEAGRPTSPFLERREERLFFDLPGFVIREELRGIARDRIDSSEHRCTVCSLPPLPSFRRNKSTDPRIRAWIRKTA